VASLSLGAIQFVAPWVDPYGVSYGLSMVTDTKQTPLHEWHTAHQARLGDFAGWEMPIQYDSGVLAEHQSVREACGVFDVSHMGTFQILGEAAANAANRLFTNDLRKLAVGQIQYTLLCTPDGGVIDDLLATRLGDQEWLLVPNAGNTAAVWDVLVAVLPRRGLVDLSLQTAIIAVQGPHSPRVLHACDLPSDMGYMRASRSGDRVVSRSGYTGEVGFELLVPAGSAQLLWSELVAAGAHPCGLAARDTLRTEMGYPLHGQDISPEISPVSAGLSWAVAWDKTEFAGKVALAQERAVGSSLRLRGIKLKEKGVPRPGMIVMAGGSAVGHLTSGTYSPTLRAGIGIALVNSQVPVGASVAVLARGREISAAIVDTPFVLANPR
jgi:aminomethyltransferase